MMKVPTIVVLLCVLLPCVAGRAVENESITLSNEDYCYNHTPSIHWVEDICYVTKVGTRLIADFPRTLRIIKEGTGNVIQYLLDVFLSKRMVGEIAQTVFAVPIDGVIRWPEIVSKMATDLGESVAHVSHDVEEFLKNHPLESVKRVLFFIPAVSLDFLIEVAPGLISTPSSIIHGVVAGLDLSGFSHIKEQFAAVKEKIDIIIDGIMRVIEQKFRLFIKILELLKVLLKDFLEKVIIKLKEFWHSVIEREWLCDRIMPSSACKVIFHAYRKMADPLFDSINAMGRKFLKFIVTALDDLSWHHVRPAFYKYCGILLPSFVCDTIVHFVEDIDKFAQHELHEFLPYAKRLTQEIALWIRTHIWDDDSSILAKIAY